MLGRILKVGVHFFKQGVQGSNVHDLFNPAGPRRSTLFPRETPAAVQFHAVDVDDTFKCISSWVLKENEQCWRFKIIFNNIHSITWYKLSYVNALITWMIKYKINAFTTERFSVTIMWCYDDELIVILNHVINAFTTEHFGVTIMWCYNNELIVIFNHVINAFITLLMT